MNKMKITNTLYVTDWKDLPFPTATDVEDSGWFVGSDRDDTFIDLGWLFDPNESSPYGEQLAAALQRKFGYKLPAKGWLYIKP